MVDQRRFENQPSQFLEAKAAAKLLGVEIRTLYAYASRGLVRSVRGASGLKRTYALDDLERLKARSGARSGHGAVAASALRWGEPVLDSAITQITPLGPAYRGRLATDLAAAHVRFENVAELLWSGYLPQNPITWPRSALSLAAIAKLVPPNPHPLHVMQLLVPLAGLADPGRSDGRPDAIVARCRQLIPLLAASLAPSAAHFTRALTATSIADVATRALGLDDDHARIIETTLIVLADHELNASSFAARVVASTDADPYACFSAALAALSGPRHGTAVESVDKDHGFGPPLYPHGDPRATPLIAAARAMPSKRARKLLAIIDGNPLHPNVDVGLAALVAALDLPPWAGSGLFAVARSAGWLAHILEQRAAGYLLRPRARYIGVTI
jgi:citrate synthase